jgi:hypothetical protein
MHWKSVLSRISGMGKKIFVVKLLIAELFNFSLKLVLGIYVLKLGFLINKIIMFFDGEITR